MPKKRTNKSRDMWILATLDAFATFVATFVAWLIIGTFLVMASLGLMGTAIG